MKAITIGILLAALYGLPLYGGESENDDKERSLVQEGVLGTVNVLRELDPRSFKNLVTVTSNAGSHNNAKPEAVIDGSGIFFQPQVAGSQPFVLTFTLPGLRTVSSLVISYAEHGAGAVRLEGSADEGTSWSEVFRSKGSWHGLKCFKPVKVNALRLTQEGGLRWTREVFVYADPDVPLPLFGSKDSGVFSFLRGLWYADKIKQFRGPANTVWAGHYGGVPHILFMSGFVGFHGAMCFGEGQKGGGSRMYLGLDLDKAYPMNYGMISGDGAFMLAAESRAEVYTANGKLDPSTLKGNSIKDLTDQGWVLQKSWDKDPNVCKAFELAHPGKYRQVLLVWDYHKAYENNRWSYLEIFGVEETEKSGHSSKR